MAISWERIGRIITRAVEVKQGTEWCPEIVSVREEWTT